MAQRILGQVWTNISLNYKHFFDLLFLAGSWSIKSKKWKKLDKEIKKKYNLGLKTTGEFYMSFEDFIEHFHWLNAAHVNQSSFLALDEDGTSSIDSEWGLRQFYGSWKEGFNAGRDNDAIYDNNIQYYLKIDSSSQVCSLVIALMQPYSAEMRKENNGEFFTYRTMIDVYKVNASQNRIDEHLGSRRKFKDEHLEICIEAGQDGQMRELTKRCYLEKGSYVVMASCYEEDADIKYLLRFLHNKDTCTLIEKLDKK